MANFITEIQDFGKLINSLLDVLRELGDNVEKKKMAAIGSMNLLKSISKERESEQAKLQVNSNFHPGFCFSITVTKRAPYNNIYMIIPRQWKRTQNARQTKILYLWYR